jgi:transposase InsO family protein
MKYGGSVHEHLNEFNSLISKLMAVDVKIDPEEKAILLLCSMPESWDNLIMSLSHATALDIDSVVSSLLTEELRRKSSQSSAGDAMVARGRSIDREQAGKDRARSKSKLKHNLKCWACNKKGHLKKDCKSINGRGSSAATDKNPQGNLVEEVGSEDGFALVGLEGSEVVRYWILDSGASFHMTPHREWFQTYRSCSGGVVYMGDSSRCKIVGIGDVKIQMFDGCVRTISNVRHVPELRKSLLSLGKFDENGLKFVGEKGYLKIIKGAMVVAKGELIGSLYKLIGETLNGEAAVASGSTESTMIWHRRLGHISERGLQILSKRGLLPGIKFTSFEFCEDCLYGKQHRLPFPSSTSRSNNCLDLIHADTCEAPCESLGGCSYFVTFIDDFSRKVWVHMLKRKSDVFEKFQIFKNFVENQKGQKIKCLRTDNGGEFCSAEFNNFCRDHGIKRHLTVPGTPQQNGVAERMNRTLMERARSMMSSAKMAKRFWAEAVNTACYVVNRSPNTSLELKTPEEVWNGKPADYSNLRVFGCIAYV